MTDWKAIQLDYTDLENYENTTPIHVCLTQRQVAILKSLLVTAYWRTRWLNLAIDIDVLVAQMSEIDSRLDGNDCECPMLDFRDNPNDLCEVQYSHDGGDTWIQAFRKDVCIPRPETTTASVEQTYIDIDNVTTNNTNYAGDITNVAPQWQYTDVSSDAAMCYVVKKYVNFVCDWAISELEKSADELREENNWLEDISSFVASVVLSTLAAIAGTVTLPAVAIGAVTWATLQVAEAFWDFLISSSTNNYADTDAREVVACWMYNKIRGATPQFDKWSVSLDDFEGDTSAETDIANIVGLFNHELDIFINWMILMEEINSISETLPTDCECPQPLIIDQLAGEAPSQFYGTELTSPSNVSLGNTIGVDFSVAPGVWFEGTEYYYDVANPIGGRACNIEIVLPHNVLVTNIAVGLGGSRPATATSGDRNYCVWLGDPNVDGVLVVTGGWGAGSYPAQEVTLHAGNPAGFIPTPRTHLYVHNSMDKNAGGCWVYWVHIECIAYTP